jgi:hypothetical protein
VRISKWLGYIQAASPYGLPPGAATVQTNCMSLVPGQLTVRGGSRSVVTTATRMLELWGLTTGAGQPQFVLGQTDQGDIVQFAVESGLSESLLVKGAFSPDHPVSFSQGRRGEVYLYQGYGKRGMVRGTDGKMRMVGMEAPTSKPEIEVDKTASFYVARVDITDAGNGYHLPPKVYIGPPSSVAPINPLLPDAPVTPPPIGSGRQATAICRIASAQVSEVEITDGGTGYTTTPCVQFTDQPGLAVTGQGAAAVLELKDGCAKGDPSTGIVFWEIFEYPTFWWMCWQEYIRQGNGFIVEATGGSGRGAKAYFELPASWFTRTQCQGANADDLKDFDVTVQVYDFGSGYKPGEEIIATVHTASSFFAGTWSPTGYLGPDCRTTALCQLKARGYCQDDPRCPDRLTVINASTYRQRALKTTLTKPGSGYLTPPTFVTEDGDTITTEVNCKGEITKLNIPNPNKTYLFPPTLLDTTGDVGKARGLAIMRATLRGKYQCYYRFVNDSVPASAGGPIYSSLSPVNEVDCGDQAAKLTWLPIPIPSGATAVELWRSTSNQATTLFRVATLRSPTKFEDKLSDYDLTNADREGFLGLPILLGNGALNANRYGVASSDFSVGVVFQDRTVLGVDTTGNRPNTLLYSEADEPESVPETNELVLQTNVRDTDYITALIPYAGALVVGQSRHCHRLTWVNDPSLDATTSLVAYRGVIGQRCWDIYQGTLFILDDMGLYSLDQQGQVEHLSPQLDTMFRVNSDASLQTIDFSKKEWFFIRADRNLGVIRVFVSFDGDAGKYPTRQIVYDPDTKSFWLENYPKVFSSGCEVRDTTGSLVSYLGSDSGLHQLGVGLTDDGAPVSWRWKSGNAAFVTDETAKTGGQQMSRNASVVYKPTEKSCLLNLQVFYNGSGQPRKAVARRDRGVGFVHSDEAPDAFVDMIAMPHEDAPTNGIARALFAGRTIADFSGNDTHIALGLHGEQTEAGPVVVHQIDLQGVEDA